MRNRIFAILCFLAIGSFFSTTAFSHSSTDLAAIEASSVPDAVAKISSMLERKGYEIVLAVDHAAGAASVGLELEPTQVIFARPPHFVERRLLDRRNTIGIDLPQKFLVFERDGEINITVNSLGYLIDRHDIPVRDRMLRLIDSTNEKFSATAKGLVTVESLQSVEDTVNSLQAAIMSNPAFRIPLVLDYGAKKNKYRDAVNTKGPVLIVFGNPNAGTPLMQATQNIGIDLPQKFLVWQDKSDKVFITYNDPVFLAARHNVEGQDARLKAIAEALLNFALIGANQTPTP